MQIKLRSKISLLFMAFAMLLALPAVALADNVSNNLDNTVDAAAEVMPLNVGGPNGSTQLYIDQTNGDGKNGCNFQNNGESLTLAVSSSNTGVATVSPSSVTFTSCGETKTLTVTPVAAGSTTISLRQTSNNTGGSFNLAPATFTVNVSAAAPANTAPQVTVDGVDVGAEYNKGSVPAATCNVTDAEDGNSSFAANLSAITGPYATDGIGSQTASCSYTDRGGLNASSSETYSIVDPSAPVITKVVTPGTPDGSNGWYKGNVTVEWIVSDPQSPNSLQKTGCVDQNITSDQAATTYSCSATSAGGSAGPESVTIKRDATKPVISLDEVKSGTLGNNGWYTTAVEYGFTAADGLSGLAVADQAFTKNITTEGSAQSVSSGTVTDLAGNEAVAIDSPNFNIDLSNPTNIQFVGGPAAGSSHDFGSVPAAPTCTAVDAVSGLAGCAVTGYSTAVGTHTLTATATDNAGRTATATRSYTVAAATAKGFYSPIDMNNAVNTVKSGSTVPAKFELFGGASGVEQKALSAVSSMSAKQISCATLTGSQDAIEEIVSTSVTGLRFDTSGDQFIYNWKTPKSPGTCYNLTMTAADQQTKLVAFFKLT